MQNEWHYTVNSFIFENKELFSFLLLFSYSNLAKAREDPALTFTFMLLTFVVYIDTGWIMNDCMELPVYKLVALLTPSYSCLCLRKRTWRSHRWQSPPSVNEWSTSASPSCPSASASWSRSRSSRNPASSASWTRFPRRSGSASSSLTSASASSCSSSAGEETVIQQYRIARY